MAEGITKMREVVAAMIDLPDQREILGLPVSPAQEHRSISSIARQYVGWIFMLGT